MLALVMPDYLEDLTVSVWYYFQKSAKRKRVFQEFRSCLCYWLGVPLHNSQLRCPECNATADLFRNHHVGCGGYGDRGARHNAIRDIIYTAAQSANLAPTREAGHLVSYSAAHPADALLPN